MRRPFTGTLLGIFIGVAISVILARQGIWPMDQLTLFLVPAVTGLAGMTLLSLGREGGTAALVVSLVVLLPMAVWGALGLGELNEHGQLNGGCEVVAASDIDQTTVTDTSRRDPFEIDPEGGLDWAATSPTPFVDYEWEIHVVLGGIPVPLDSGTEPNDAGSLINGAEIPAIGVYAEERGLAVDLLTGVYEVGGFASSCDGFGFVKLVADGFDTVALIALGVGLVLLIALIALTFTGRATPAVDVGSREYVVDRPPEDDV
ncbi:MAG TPA: hypothetical protein VG872_02745 [Acidimicrobiia bacterium]|jgi:hypothetical protein|nr:hypothetical protein [Acidimicrobiia bacterium]